MVAKDEKREIWLDWLRVTACFMVMATHSCEPFYLGGEGSLILTKADALWVSILNVIPRAAIALFIFTSSYLQFPLHYSAGEFFKRRAKRILVPFIFWSLVYAFVWGEPVQNLKDLIWNFNYAAGHLWFVYMLIGVYLIMPLLSPWAEKVGKCELQIYLAIWLFTTIIPLIRQWVGGPAPVMYGPSGIPNAARYPLWGEASWNAYGVFYYLSGFIGYLLLGLYFRKFVGRLSWGRTLAIAILAALWEGPWLNDTFGVALMTLGWVLVFRKIETGGRFYERVLLPVSQASYGMYLCHMLLLGLVSAWLRSSLGLGSEGALGAVWTTPVQILGTAVLSFIGVAVFSVLVQKIPKVGKWLMG